jgi:acetyl-CoA acyltransferase
MREVVVVDAIRSPIGKSGWGGKKQGMLSETSAQDLLAQILRTLTDRVKEKAAGFEEEMIEEVLVGCLTQIGEQGANIARIASLIAGLPHEVSGSTVNRYCNAGLSAVNWAAQSIMTNAGDIMIASGVELMSHYGMGDDVTVAMEAGKKVVFSDRFGDTGMTTPQGLSAEMVADKYGLTREDMDRFGLWSNQKAVQAQRDGRLEGRIVPIIGKDAGGNEVRISADETPRAACLDDPEGALAKMATLPSRFKEEGMVTAGNSSQIVDGAAAVMLMEKNKAKELGLKPLATIRSFGNAGGDPLLMLLAPIPAAEKALARAGKGIADMDVIEPNEAFASPCLAFARHFEYADDDPRVNPSGGAIALGHPIGASGVIYFSEMCHELNARDGRWGLQLICGGGGIGIATVVEREDY